MTARNLIAIVSAAVVGLAPSLPLVAAPVSPAHLRVLARRNVPSASETAFVTADANGTIAEFGTTEQYGYGFTVGGSQITITQLGCERQTGTYADFTVKLFSSDGTTELASAVCDYDSVAVGEVAYTAITSVVVAASAVRYIRLVNSNYNTFKNFGGNPESDLTTTSAATISTESQYDGMTHTTNSGTSAYVDFKYTIP